jgi:hypothetical protein
VALGVTGFVLSLGPYLHGAGARIGPPLPYAALYHWVPGFASVRTPARLAVLVMLAAAVLAAVGYGAARARTAGRPGWRWAAAGIFALAVAGAAQRPLATLSLPGPAELPPAYAWVARQPDAGPLLDVPVAAAAGNEGAADILRQYYVLLHGLPRLDGASGFVSPRYRRFRAALWRFPEPGALREAAALGARWVVVHLDDYAPAERARLRTALAAAPELTLAARFGGDAVYRLGGAGAP